MIRLNIMMVMMEVCNVRKLRSSGNDAPQIIAFDNE